MRVAFLGPAGTFTEEALRTVAPPDAEELPYPTVYEAIMAVHEGEAERALVPIENSLEGSVTATLDVLAGEAADVRIAGEVLHRIRHCLIARPGTRLEDLRRVVSHPQATAQCARFLRERLPLAEHVSAASTAEAVSTVAGAREPWAALGSRLAAQLYGCEVLVDGVEDTPENVTRFAWLARADGPHAADRPSGPRKTSIVFWGFNDQAPGALVAVLSELSERGVNMTKIESRPRRLGLGHYMFFADLEGDERDDAVREALAGLASRVETLKVLGSYPAAELD